MNIGTIRQRLLAGGMHGDEIAESRNYIAVMLSRMYEEYGQCLSFGAGWTTDNRENYKSQAECERAYEATEEGKKETRLKHAIKSYEAIQEVLTSAWFAINKEARATQ